MRVNNGRFSGERGDGVLWRTALQEVGQSEIRVFGDRLYFTTMAPMDPGNTKREGADIVGHAVDGRSGKILWSVAVPGTEPSPYAYGFSDSSTPTPVCDRERVVFVNASGGILCCDPSGRELWRKSFAPTTGRPFNKQFEPILSGGVLLNLEPRPAGDPKRETDPWNYVVGRDLRTGEIRFVSDDALTHYTTPVLGKTARGETALLIGRGGYHDVPESPGGLSLVSVDGKRAGATIWRREFSGKALYNLHWNRAFAFWFDLDKGTHTTLSATDGRVLRTHSLDRNVGLWRWDAARGSHVWESELPKTTRVFPAWFTNAVVGNHHYFLCFTDAAQNFGPAFCVGRIEFTTGRCEYLELPTAPGRSENGAKRDATWGKNVPSSTKNARGIDVAQDPRSRRDGWFWCFLPAPVSIGNLLYFTSMAGVVYAIDTKARELDAAAIAHVSDLGAVGKTWSLNNIAAGNGRRFHRTITELVGLRG